MLTRSTVIKITLAALALTAPAFGPASANAEFINAILGEKDGFTASKGKDGYFIHVSRKAQASYKLKLAGKKLEVGCVEIKTPRDQFSGWQSSSMSTDIKLPKKPGRIDTYVSKRDKADYCFIDEAGRSSGMIAKVAVTPKGRLFLEEETIAVNLLLTSEFGDLPVPAGLTLETLTREQLRKLTLDQILALQVDTIRVRLNSPDEIPPAGKVGQWSEGTRVYVSALTKAGRKLFIDTDGDVIRTNVNTYLRETF